MKNDCTLISFLHFAESRAMWLRMWIFDMKRARKEEGRIAETKLWRFQKLKDQLAPQITKNNRFWGSNCIVRKKRGSGASHWKMKTENSILQRRSAKLWEIQNEFGLLNLLSNLVEPNLQKLRSNFVKENWRWNWIKGWELRRNIRNQPAFRERPQDCKSTIPGDKSGGIKRENCTRGWPRG